MYNVEHHHPGIGLMTPADVHHGRADKVIAARQAVLDGAHAAHQQFEWSWAGAATATQRRGPSLTAMSSTKPRRASPLLFEHVFAYSIGHGRLGRA
jgi:hypothetical protein